MYSSGAGLRKNYVEAMRWYRKAASQGNVEAEHALGYMYLHGQGVPPDHTKAFHWIEKAARKGDASAEASLGYMYSHGQGVRQDRAAAMRWYRKAAAQGNAAAKQAVDASENGFGRAITTRWFELVTAFMGFIAGSWTLLGGLWPGRTRGWRRNAITLLGICFLADGGLSLYAFSYGDRYSPHLLAFNIARFLFTAVAVLIVVAVVLPAKKTVPHR